MLRLEQRLWLSWIRNPIFADAGVQNIAPRIDVIHEFIVRGLFPWVKSKGYEFAYPSKEITLSLLRYMFSLSLGKKVVFKNPHKSVHQDHRFEFEHRFDTLELEAFWKRWSCIEDFTEGNSASTLQFTLPDFLWASIDLSNSPITSKIESIMKEINEYEGEELIGIPVKRESKGKEDPYLHESMKYEDKHW